MVTKIDLCERARTGFRRLFMEDENKPGELIFSQQAVDDAWGDRPEPEEPAKFQGKIVRVFKRETQASPTKRRRKGWLYKEVRRA